ncbi:MAG TPA: HepT-like ribonuclease domain-containing protein [Candidatus Tripitaka californicus]|uniref:HepT-like ribonuclease domain-containing protein n=1 Tax=Candidatus Tripitaka californicus TaxID=3367616 RepID=UPI0040276DF0|nr:DUF86 domain-containing protein [Planctomycetota bacterium]
MKPKRDYKLFVKDIWDSINKIEEFTKGLGFEEFIKDDKTVSAVIRKIEIIGEAARNIPKSIKQKYPQLNWKGMTGMRDKLIHEYFGVDHEILWKVINEDIPSIKPPVKQILEDMEKEG